MRKNLLWLIPAAVVVCLGAAVALFFVPPIHDRLAYRVENALAQVRNFIKPPEKEVFVPVEQQIDEIVRATLQAYTPPAPPTATFTPTPQATLTGPTATPAPSATATPIPTEIPAAVTLTGFKHEYQGWNNCGPATVSVTLSFWGWVGNQNTTAAVLKPNTRDKNVMPYEMADYVNGNTSLRALTRMGGDLPTLKRLIAAGFPVIIERGFEPPKEDWMGHYEALVGYDDAKSRFIAQDVYIMPDLPVPYSEIELYWQHFNHVFVVIYPPEREGEVLSALGPLADETAAYQHAAEAAQEEINAFSGRQLFFAWYNLGTSLVKLGDYVGAASAYDQAFTLYNLMDPEDRPWRSVWYQTGPYFAYYYTGRYTDVVNLATSTLSRTGEPALEESWYWRAMAHLALGEQDEAIDDLRTSLKWHAGFEPSVAKLNELGVEP